MSLKTLKPLSSEPEISTNVETQGVDTSATPLTVESLLSLIATLTKQNAESNAALAAAIIKTTEPREALKTKEQIAREANDALFDANAKELRKRQRENLRFNQDRCDHIAGGSDLSEQRDVHGRTSIVWHRTDAQIDVGVCTTCDRHFHPEDALDAQGHDYTYWRRKPSFNKLSTAGFRQFMNPLKAQHDSYLRDS